MCALHTYHANENLSLPIVGLSREKQEREKLRTFNHQSGNIEAVWPESGVESAFFHFRYLRHWTWWYYIVCNMLLLHSLIFIHAHIHEEYIALSYYESCIWVACFDALFRILYSFTVRYTLSRQIFYKDHCNMGNAAHGTCVKIESLLFFCICAFPSLFSCIFKTSLKKKSLAWRDNNARVFSVCNYLPYRHWMSYNKNFNLEMVNLGFNEEL